MPAVLPGHSILGLSDAYIDQGALVRRNVRFEYYK